MMEQSQELLQPERYIVNPVEDLDAEYKGWLDLRTESDRARLAKAVIALANHGGGVVILGFEELSTGVGGGPSPGAAARGGHALRLALHATPGGQSTRRGWEYDRRDKRAYCLRC